ncbi:MAG: 30S ribosomal protein S3ae, partial [Thermoplasmata archaeon]|nr:30S ribosomal protein S3ae [Thermoplasmata archaeon]
HTLTTDYVRRLIRRRRSRIDGVYDVNTKDGALIRLKPFATTERRIQTSQKHEIRKIMKDTVISYAKDRTLSELIKGILNEELSKEISKNCKKFYPLRKVEVYKSELLKRPTLKMEEPKKKKEAEKTEESKEEKPKPKEEKTEEKEVIEKEKPKEEKIKKKPKKTAKKTNKKENKTENKGTVKKKTTKKKE